MQRAEIYNNIVNAYESSYSWWGKDFAEQALMSACSYNLQVHNKAPFRLRRHLLVFAPQGWYKCLEENQPILTEEGYVPIKEYNDSKNIISIKEGKGIVTNALKSKSIMKSTIKVVTCGGYEVICGKEHPFLVIDYIGNISWKKVKYLEKTDILIMAKPTISDWFIPTEKINPETARLVGYLIGDGSYCSKNKIGFTNAKKEISDDYKFLIKKYISEKEIKEYSDKRSNTFNYELHSTDARKKLYNEFGLTYLRSPEKVIPNQFIVPDKKILENLLYGLYQTDGGLRTNGIYFSSTSVKLLKQIQTILLLLGVNSKKLNSNRNNTQLRVIGWNNIAKLPLFFKSKHGQKIEEIANRRNNATNLIPLGSKIITQKIKYRQKSINQQFREINKKTKYLRDRLGKPKDKFAFLCEKLNLPELSFLCSEDLFFEKIKELYADNKPKSCYDLFVPQTNQFITNGFLTHNSALLHKFYKLIGKDLCACMSDLSLAALRGTSEGNSFIVPYTLKRPFAICTEFGQISASWQNPEVVQKLLNVLEEGVVEVSLSKIAYLSEETRDDISKRWGVYFVDKNTFSYETNWVLMVGTYNKKFLSDNALESRFNILYPSQKLDNELVKYVMNAPPFAIDEETDFCFKSALLDKKPIDTNIKLPNEVYSINKITPRDCGALMSYILCRSWWNIATPKDDIIKLAEQIQKSREEIWKTAEDRVCESLELGPKTIDEIAKETDITKRHVYNCLKGIGAYQTMQYDADGAPIRVWKI